MEIKPLPSENMPTTTPLSSGCVKVKEVRQLKYIKGMGICVHWKFTHHHCKVGDRRRIDGTVNQIVRTHIIYL